MPNKKCKRMNNKYTNQREGSAKKITVLEHGELCLDLVECVRKKPKCFKEIKRKDGEWEEIPGAEITFPIEGNLFYVKLLQCGDSATDIVASFCACLFDRYAPREFHVSGEHRIIFAVDTPAEDIALIWDTIARLYNLRYSE